LPSEPESASVPPSKGGGPIEDVAPLSEVIAWGAGASGGAR
jgi:hypothetical protein